MFSWGLRQMEDAVPTRGCPSKKARGVGHVALCQGAEASGDGRGRLLVLCPWDGSLQQPPELNSWGMIGFRLYCWKKKKKEKKKRHFSFHGYDINLSA